MRAGCRARNIFITCIKTVHSISFHFALFTDTVEQGLSVGGTLRRVPVGGIVAVFQKHQPIAARMFGEPVPNGPGVVRLLRDGHIAIGNDPKFGKPLGRCGKDTLIVRVPAALNVGHPPFFCGMGGSFFLNSLGSVAGGRGNGGKEQTAAHQHKEEQTAKAIHGDSVFHKVRQATVQAAFPEERARRDIRMLPNRKTSGDDFAFTCILKYIQGQHMSGKPFTANQGQGSLRISRFHEMHYGR